MNESKSSKYKSKYKKYKEGGNIDNIMNSIMPFYTKSNSSKIKLDETESYLQNKYNEFIKNQDRLANINWNKDSRVPYESAYSPVKQDYSDSNPDMISEDYILNSIGNKPEVYAKNDMFNYYQSPQYAETAKKMWGNDYNKNINSQLDIINNTTVNPFNKMSLFDKSINLNSNSYAEFNPFTKQINAPTYQKDYIKHEISHASDANSLMPNDILIKSNNAFYAPKLNKNKYTPYEIDVYTGMDNSFKKWTDRASDFKYQAKNKNISNQNYFSNPSEIRARVNMIRQEMQSNGYDWNKANKDELFNYINNIKDPIIKKQFDDIRYLDDETIFDLFQNYAQNNKQEDMNKKYIAKYGGKIPNKPQQYGWGSTIGGIAGGALGTLLGPFGTTIGAGLGSQLGNMIDGEENTQGNMPQMPQLNIDPINTQDFYNPVKAYGGYLPEFAMGGLYKSPRKKKLFFDSISLGAANTYSNEDAIDLNVKSRNFNEKQSKNLGVNFIGGVRKGSNLETNAMLNADIYHGRYNELEKEGKKGFYARANVGAGVNSWNNKLVPNINFGSGVGYKNSDKYELENYLDFNYNDSPKTLIAPVGDKFYKNNYIPTDGNQVDGKYEPTPRAALGLKGRVKVAKNLYAYGDVSQDIVNLSKKVAGTQGEDFQGNQVNFDINKPKVQFGLTYKIPTFNPKNKAVTNGQYKNTRLFSDYAYGGNINPNAEVEGNEVIQYQPGMQPKAIGQGNMQQIASDMSVAKGPTHANGGVPVVAQPGSMVVSDRLPAPNTKEYKSIANKVEQLGRKKGQLEKKIEKNPNDKIAKDTIGLVQKQIDTLIQQQEQMKAMNAESIMAKAYQKAYGGNINLDPMFLELWNTGSYAYGGGVPTEEEMYPGITNEYRKTVQNIKLNPDGTMDWDNTLNTRNKINIPSQQANTGSLLDYSKPTDINNPSGQNMSKTNLTGSEEDLFKTTLPNRLPKRNLLNNFGNIGNNLQYAAQYIPDVMAMFTKKDKPIDPNMYMNTSRVTPAKYDTSAEEAAVIDARNQAMMLAKETSGGDAGMYANLGNIATTGAYKNLGQVYNRAQNINMQNKMAADQANAGIEGQNRQMALNVANMNQADAQAVESMRQAGMQGLSNKLANQYSQNKQFKLLESMFPHYKYNNDGSVTYNGKTYYGDEATGIVDNLKMYASKLGINWFGGK